MTGLDPTGDWLGRGARALDNPRTATGEESLERLRSFLDDLNQGGKRSETFLQLKGKVFLRDNPQKTLPHSARDPQTDAWDVASRVQPTC